MAREFTFEQPIMAHDVIEVDEGIFMGERGSRPASTRGRSLIQRLKGYLVIFTGEIPHSSVETAFDFVQPTRPVSSAGSKKLLSGFISRLSVSLRRSP